MGLEIGNSGWGLEIGIGDWDWALGLGIAIKYWGLRWDGG